MGSKGTCNSTWYFFDAAYALLYLLWRITFLGKSSGQYMIANEHLIDRIIEHSGIRSSDTVLELGCGTGSVTTRLLPICRKVYVCESDRVLGHEVVSRVASEGYTNMELLAGDAMGVSFPRFDVCISNLPYALSAPILFKLIQHRPLWRSTMLILQREFTDALIADPGERNYSRLSMNASVFVRSERVSRINGSMFYPVPSVESALVKLVPRNPPPEFNFLEFDKLSKVCFLEKKRMIRNIFDRPSILKQLEGNYKLYCSFHGKPTDTRPFPKYLGDVLEASQLAEACARKMPPEAMEHLLTCLHEAGIFFTNLTSSPVLGRVERGEGEDEKVFQSSIPTHIPLKEESMTPLPVVS